MINSTVQDVIRWLHFSDFHVGKDNYAQIKLFEEMLSEIKNMWEKGFIPNFIFITGDIVYSAKKRDYGIFCSKFIEPLLNISGNEFLNRLFIVPGNHDVNRDISKFFNFQIIQLNESHLFDPSKDGLDERKQFLPRFKNYRNSKGITPKQWLDSENGSFTSLIELSNGNKVGVIGINTALISMNGDRGQISPGVEILDEALNKANGCDVKFVLGHHPIDWFYDYEPIKSVLGHHHAIYLHGHLHKNRVNPLSWGGIGFLALQSGAAFITRSDEENKNGFLLGEINLSNSSLRLQPRKWNPANREWQIVSDLPGYCRMPGEDWWIFELPDSKTNPRKSRLSSHSEVKFPEGWQLIDQNSTNYQNKKLDKNHAIKYFDGANPDWEISASKEIPRLTNEIEIYKSIISYNFEDKSQATLLIGPIGEGKTTILMQVVYDLISNNSWNILWKSDQRPKIDIASIIQLPKLEKPWLLAIDLDCEIIDEVYSTCEFIHKNHRTDIHLLLACRDTDWKESLGEKYKWGDFVNFKKITISGLSLIDARAIVSSWLNFGNEGMGKLTGTNIERAAIDLYELSHQAEIKEGAFFGALLKARYGDDLQEHVKTLLNRLNDRNIPGGKDLLDAFSYIALMHSENLKFLPKSILADVLNCPSEKISSLVLYPLGRESVISKDSQYILTRHHELAKTAAILLQDLFFYDLDNIFLDLIDSAVTLYKKGEYIPFLQGWFFDISKYFSDKGRHGLAIKIAEMVFYKNPYASSHLISLSKIYRAARASGKASKLFRRLNNDQSITKDRDYLLEWGLAEISCEKIPLGLLLIAMALNDHIDSFFPYNKFVTYSLYIFCRSSLQLYHLYNESAFNDGHIASCRLGMILPTKNPYSKELVNFFNKEHLNFIKDESEIDNEILKLETSINLAWDYCVSDKELFKDYFLQPSDMTFNKLKHLIKSGFIVSKSDKDRGIIPIL